MVAAGHRGMRVAIVRRVRAGAAHPGQGGVLPVAVPGMGVVAGLAGGARCGPAGSQRDPARGAVGCCAGGAVGRHRVHALRRRFLRLEGRHPGAGDGGAAASRRGRTHVGGWGPVMATAGVRGPDFVFAVPVALAAAGLREVSAGHGIAEHDPGACAVCHGAVAGGCQLSLGGATIPALAQGRSSFGAFPRVRSLGSGRAVSGRDGCGIGGRAGLAKPGSTDGVGAGPSTFARHSISGMRWQARVHGAQGMPDWCRRNRQDDIGLG